MDKKTLKKILLLSAFMLVGILIFLVVWMVIYQQLISDITNPEDLIRVIKTIVGRRAIQVLAIVIGVVLISLATVSFQTISESRILTPSVLGFDGIFVITQTAIVALLGVNNLLIANDYINFVVTTLIMIVIVLLVYQLILRNNKNNIMLLLLVGIIISSLSRTFATFLQVIMNPDDFSSVIALTNVSLTNVNTTIVIFCVPITLVVAFLFFRQIRYYDVLILGQASAINLGIEYNKKVKLTLIYIAIAVAIATALIGPLTFLGLIAIAITREMFKTNKHLILMIGSTLVSLVIVIYGQIILELLHHITSLSVIINLIGGVYLIYIILRENKL